MMLIWFLIGFIAAGVALFIVVNVWCNCSSQKYAPKLDAEKKACVEHSSLRDFVFLDLAEKIKQVQADETSSLYPLMEAVCDRCQSVVRTENYTYDAKEKLIYELMKLIPKTKKLRQ